MHGLIDFLADLHHEVSRFLRDLEHEFGPGSASDGWHEIQAHLRQTPLHPNVLGCTWYDMYHDPEREWRAQPHEVRAIVHLLRDPYPPRWWECSYTPDGKPYDLPGSDCRFCHRLVSAGDPMVHDGSCRTFEWVDGLIDDPYQDEIDDATNDHGVVDWGIDSIPANWVLNSDDDGKPRPRQPWGRVKPGIVDEPF